MTVCVALPSSATAARSAQVRVVGATVFSPDKVRALVVRSGARPGSPKWLDGAHEAYYREGYLDVTFAVSFETPDSTWRIDVNEGEMARVGRVSVNGIAAGDSVRTALGLDRGDPFRPVELTRKVQLLLGRYDDDGFPYAQVRIDSIGYAPETRTVDVVVYVLDGRRRTIRSVRVEGLTKTRPDLAARICGVAPGDVYSAQALEDAYVRLGASGLFGNVEGPHIQASADGYGVDAIFDVDEPERSHVFTAAAGYAAAEGDEKRELSGMAHLQLVNLGGGLKDFELFWANDGRERNETRVDYRDRFLFGRRFGVGLHLEQVGLDTLYTWQSAGFDVTRPVGWIDGGASTVSAGAFIDRNVFGVGDLLRSLRTRLMLGASVARGSQRRAGLLRASVRATYGRKRNVSRSGESDSSVDQFIVGVEVDGFRSLSGNLGARVRVRYDGLESRERLLPISEQFYVGGARSLRGYKENQFRGRRVATMRNEFFVGPTWQENVYAFADLGYVLTETAGLDDNVSREERFLSGYGFGLRTLSRAGTIDLSFALGERLSLRQTKVHVILEQNF